MKSLPDVVNKTTATTNPTNQSAFQKAVFFMPPTLLDA